MKIIHIFPYSARIPGGHSNAIREFITCQRAAGMEAFGISPCGTEGSTDGYELGEWIHELPFDRAETVFSRISGITDSKPAILHLHAVDRFNTELARQAVDHGLTVVLTSHGQLNCRSMLHGFQKAVYLAACRSPVRHAAGIHVLTQRERGRLRLMIPWFRGPIGIIPHVVEIPGDPPAADATPRDFKPLTILHIGRLDVQTKGLDLLVEGFAKSGLDQARLILAGPDWNNGRAMLETLARDLGCAGRVEFPGAVYGADKERLLDSADLFVAASRWDAFNISLVEAMARGVPALVSDRLNLATALAAADAAAVVACSAKGIANELLTLANDPLRRTRLGHQGREWTRTNCSPDKIGSGFGEFYQRIHKKAQVV